MNISRRKFLILGGGTLVLSGAGFSYVHSHKDNFLLSRLSEFIGDFEVTETEFKKFNDHFRAYISEARYERYHTMIMMEKLTFNGKIDPLKISQRIDKWDRRLVTQFILTTDYLDNSGKNISFKGITPACGNPFADFSFS